jgi:hypothetical protein
MEIQMPVVKLNGRHTLSRNPQEQRGLGRLRKHYEYFDLALRHKKVRVSDVEADALCLADEAISKTKELLPFGAPNQIVDIWLTNAENVMRRRERLLSPASDSLEQIVRSGAGNCGEHARVTFALLAGTARSEPVSRVTAAGVDHVFNVIGDHRQSDRVAVADSWVTFPVAHLYRHGSFPIDQIKETAPPQVHEDPKYQILSEWSQSKPLIEARSAAIDFLKKSYGRANSPRFFNQWASLARLGGQYATEGGQTFDFDRFPKEQIAKYMNAMKEYERLFEVSDDEWEEEADEDELYQPRRSPSLTRRLATTTL